MDATGYTIDANGVLSRVPDTNIVEIPYNVNELSVKTLSGTKVSQHDSKNIFGNTSPSSTAKRIFLPTKRRLTTIDNGAFVNTNLSELKLPETVTTIGSNAFRNSKLTSIEIPTTVTSIGDNTFYITPALTSVVFKTRLDGSSDLRTIGQYAFANSKLSSVEIPWSVQTIGQHAFGYNSELTSVTLPTKSDGTSALTTIGEGAFRSGRFTSITIPSGVTSIGQYALANNGALTTARVEAPSPPTLTESMQIFFGAHSSLSIKVPPGNATWKTTTIVEDYRAARLVGVVMRVRLRRILIRGRVYLKSSGAIALEKKVPPKAGRWAERKSLLDS